jgi:hypothetical protein
LLLANNKGNKWWQRFSLPPTNFPPSKDLEALSLGLYQFFKKKLIVCFCFFFRLCLLVFCFALYFWWMGFPSPIFIYRVFLLWVPKLWQECLKCRVTLHQGAVGCWNKYPFDSDGHSLCDDAKEPK